MTETTVKIMSPEEIAARQVGDVPPIRFAEPGQVFRDRELRLRQLAAGHPMRDYLIFMADVAAAQHRALASQRMVALPTEEQLGDAARAGVAPLAVQPHQWRRPHHQQRVQFGQDHRQRVADKWRGSVGDRAQR